MYNINSTDDTKNFAKILVEKINTKSVILLQGELGVGKTTLVKFLLEDLGCNQLVSSPSFNILNIYESNIGEVFHFDLYRIHSTLELEEIGFFHALSSGVVIIEWPQLIAEHLSLMKEKNIILVEMNFKDEISDNRVYSIAEL